MDYLAILLSPYFLLTFGTIFGGILAWIFIPTGNKREPVWVAERVKIGEWAFDFKAKMIRPKIGEVYLKMKDRRKFIIPEEKLNEFQRVLNRKSGKFGKMWRLENGQITDWPQEELAIQANPLLDQAVVTAVQNRTSAKRLAAGISGGNNYILLAFAIIAGLAIGYIVYPQFNHPAPVVEFCTRLTNGTVIPRTLCPQ